MSTTVVSHRCPSCDRPQDAMTGANGTAPKPGDVGICWACGAVGVWTGTALRPPTEAEAEEFDADPQIARVRAAIRAAATPAGAADVVWGSS